MIDWAGRLFDQCGSQPANTEKKNKARRSDANSQSTQLEPATKPAYPSQVLGSLYDC